MYDLWYHRVFLGLTGRTPDQVKKATVVEMGSVRITKHILVVIIYFFSDASSNYLNITSSAILWSIFWLSRWGCLLNGSRCTRRGSWLDPMTLPWSSWRGKWHWYQAWSARWVGFSLLLWSLRLQACLDHQRKIKDRETKAEVQGCSQINLFQKQ